MLLSDLIIHARSVLPLFDTNFTDNVSISSLTKSSNDVTVISTAHGLSVGDQAIISGVRESTVITNLTTTNKTVTATCATNHDLTFGYDKNVNIESGTSDYNGTFTLVSVPSSKTFTFKIETNPSDGVGTLLTFHNLGFNGVQTVSNVVNVNSFVYVLNDDSLLAGKGDAMLVMKSPRISGAATLTRAIESYTRKSTPGLWGFFVLEPAITSDDRNIDNDSKNERQIGEDFKLRIIQSVSFYVFIPTNDEISGRLGMDNAQKLVKPIYKTLAAYKIDTSFNNEQLTLLMPSSHEIEEYNASFIIYRYEFQNTEFMFRRGDSKDPLEFMANTGDAFPDMLTKGLKLFKSTYINDKLETIREATFEVQN